MIKHFKASQFSVSETCSILYHYKVAEKSQTLTTISLLFRYDMLPMALKQKNQRKWGYSQGRQKMIQFPLSCHLHVCWP